VSGACFNSRLFTFVYPCLLIYTNTVCSCQRKPDRVSPGNSGQQSTYQNFCQVGHTLRLLSTYFYGFRKVKVYVTLFIKHNAITSAYLNLWSSNMAYQNPWWKAIKVICTSLRSKEKKRQEGAFYYQITHSGMQ